MAGHIVASTPAGAASLKAAAAEKLEKNALDRQPLIDWGESLCREVASLEKERVDLERRLADTNAELEQFRRRCAELEKLVRQSQAVSSKVLALPARESAENSELRKQLAAYAVEIDVLREEKANEQRQLRGAQEKAHSLLMEKEDMSRKYQELERSSNDTKNKLLQLEGLLGQAGEGRTKAEGQLRDAKAELSVMGASLQQAQDKGFDQQYMVGHRLQEADRTLAERDHRVKDLADLVHLLREQLVLTQERCVQQTREYGQFVAQVRERHAAAQRDFESAEKAHVEQSSQMREHSRSVMGLQRQFARLMEDRKVLQNEKETLNSDWESSYAALEEDHQRVDAERQEHLATAQALDQAVQDKDKREADRRQARRERVHHVSRFNNATAFSRACCAGAVVERINEKGKRETRALIVEDNMGNDSKYLKWQKTSASRFSSKGVMRVNLREIVVIGFGFGSRAAFDPDTLPWRCFSVYTRDRSYDFICQDDADAEAFVITISHLRKRISGFTLPGGMSNHRSFLAASGWCKVQHACFKRRLSLARALESCLPAAAGRSARTSSMIPERPPSIGASSKVLQRQKTPSPGKKKGSSWSWRKKK